MKITAWPATAAAARLPSWISTAWNNDLDDFYSLAATSAATPTTTIAPSSTTTAATAPAAS